MALQSVSIVNIAIDNTPPTVTATTPANGATGVGVDRPDHGNLLTRHEWPVHHQATNFYLNNGVTGSVSYDCATKTATFTPSSNLAYNTTYTATISTGVTSAVGTPMASAKTWSFTTALPRNLAVSISGNGSLNSNPTGIACSTGNLGTCSHLFPDGTPLTLTATGINGTELLSHFGAWQPGVCDSENGAVCSVTMNGDKNITATFITNQPVRIDGASYYPSLQAAYNGTVATGVAIQAQAVAFSTLDFTLDSVPGKTVTLEGGYDSRLFGQQRLHHPARHTHPGDRLPYSGEPDYQVNDMDW